MMMSSSEVPGLEGGVELKGHTHVAPEGQEGTVARDSPYQRLDPIYCAAFYYQLHL